jgi:hypothetical protein
MASADEKQDEATKRRTGKEILLIGIIRRTGRSTNAESETLLTSCLAYLD